MALIMAKRVDKDTADTTFITFCEDLLKLTLQEIIAEVPHARWLMDEDTLTATSGQQYINLPSDMDIDAFVSMRDETNNRPVIRIDPASADLVDPGRDLTGNAILFWFQRVADADRLYFLNRPDSAYTLKLMFGNVITDPTTTQTCALPAKYESTWMEGAMEKLYPRIQEIDYRSHRSNFEKGLDRIKRDANRAFGQSDVLASSRGAGDGPHGPSFPANFDITG